MNQRWLKMWTKYLFIGFVSGIVGIVSWIILEDHTTLLAPNNNYKIAPSDPIDKENPQSFIIEEKWIETKDQIALWKILHWSKDRNGKPVRTTAKAMRPVDTSVKRPGLIWNHGGRQLCAPEQKLLNYVRLGYIVIAPDYQGCDGLGEKDYFFTSQIHDVLGALNWLKSHPDFVDTTRIYMVGYSRGGAITLKTLNTLSDLGRAQEIKAAAVQGIVYSAEAMSRSQVLNDVRAEKDILVLTRKYNKSRDELAALYQSELPDIPESHNKIVTPLFIAHGAEDTWVLPENSEKLADDLAKIGVKHKLKLYKGAKHGFEEPQLSEYFKDVQLWFLENS